MGPHQFNAVTCWVYVESHWFFEASYSGRSRTSPLEIKQYSPRSVPPASVTKSIRAKRLQSQSLHLMESVSETKSLNLRRPTLIPSQTNRAPSDGRGGSKWGTAKKCPPTSLAVAGSLSALESSCLEQLASKLLYVHSVL